MWVVWTPRVQSFGAQKVFGVAMQFNPVESKVAHVPQAVQKEPVSVEAQRCDRHCDLSVQRSPRANCATQMLELTSQKYPVWHCELRLQLVAHPPKVGAHPKPPEHGTSAR